MFHLISKYKELMVSRLNCTDWPMEVIFRSRENLFTFDIKDLHSLLNSAVRCIGDRANIVISWRIIAFKSFVMVVMMEMINVNLVAITSGDRQVRFSSKRSKTLPTLNWISVIKRS